MKKLQDICIFSIAENLSKLPRIGQFLAPRYKELVLERLITHDMLTPEHLPHITYQLFSKSLKDITLYKCQQVDDSILRALGSCGAQFRTIKVNNCKEVTDAGVSALLKGQKEFEYLQLRKLPKLTRHGLKHIKSPNLVKLDLKANVNIDSKGVANAVANNPRIKILNIKMCSHLDDSVFTAIAETLKENLEELNAVQVIFMQNSGLLSLAQNCPNLKKFYCHGANKITGEGLSKLLENCTLLQDLDLSYCSVATTNCITELPTKVQRLSICGVMLSNDSLFIEAMSRLTSLTHVRFCGVPAFNDNTIDPILEVLGENLEMLDLSGSIMSEITDEGLKSVSKYCTNLQTLGINLLKDVTGVTLIPLFERPPAKNSLKELHLSCKKLDDSVLYVVAKNCVNLTLLDLGGLTAVDDPLCFTIASNCRQLTSISLKGAPLVTDLAVIEIARCCALKSVILSGLHRLTDKSLFALANSCPYLEEVFMNGCVHITRTCIRYLLVKLTVQYAWFSSRKSHSPKVLTNAYFFSQDCCIPRVYIQHRIPNADPKMLMAKNLDTGEFQRADLMDYSM